jgi:O-methyltransferase
MIRSLFPVLFQPPAGLWRRFLARTGYFRARTWLAARGGAIPDAHLYQPLYSPWLGAPDFEAEYGAIAAHTLVSRDRCYVLWRMIRQALALGGDVVECGVYRGGTALLIARAIAAASPGRRLLLFDTFKGLPTENRDIDRMGGGDLAETSVEAVGALLGEHANVSICPGFVPDSFAGRDIQRVAFAHVDLDLYQGTQGALAFLYPRMVPGGIMVIDDYGFPSCPGARRAVDEFFADRPEAPLCLPTGQCLVVRLDRPAS